MDHFDEELELYALGMLEPPEQARVDEHVRTCDACAERLGRAEAAVTALVAGAQQRRVRRLPSWPIAVAAAFALTSAVLFGQNVALRGALASDGHMLDAIVLSHFVHVPFSAVTAEPVVAKVIYEQHGHWYQIVAERPADWSVTVTRADGTVQPIAAKPEARGSASTLSLAALGPLRAIDLHDAHGRIIAHARPALTPDAQ